MADLIRKVKTNRGYDVTASIDGKIIVCHFDSESQIKNDFVSRMLKIKSNIDNAPEPDIFYTKEDLDNAVLNEKGRIEIILINNGYLKDGQKIEDISTTIERSI